MDDIAGTLTDVDVAGRAGEAIHTLIDTVVVDWDTEAQVHTLELRGKFLELLNVSGSVRGILNRNAAAPFWDRAASLSAAGTQ